MARVRDTWRSQRVADFDWDRNMRIPARLIWTHTLEG